MWGRSYALSTWLEAWNCFWAKSWNMWVVQPKKNVKAVELWNWDGLQILSSFVIIIFKIHHSSPFTYLSVLAFQSCFASVFYHINFVLQRGCVYSIMASSRSKIQVRIWEETLLLDNILRKFKTQCWPHDYYPFLPYLPTICIKSGQTSVTRAWQNVKSSERKSSGQGQESREAVELEKFR